MRSIFGTKNTWSVGLTFHFVTGLVVTSSNPSIMSAGLDLTEMYQCEEKNLRVFWKSLQRMWYLLYTFEKPLASAICGHAPAAGTLIPVTSDYRFESLKMKYVRVFIVSIIF